METTGKTSCNGNIHYSQLLFYVTLVKDFVFINRMEMDFSKITLFLKVKKTATLKIYYKPGVPQTFPSPGTLRKF